MHDDRSEADLMAYLISAYLGLLLGALAGALVGYAVEQIVGQAGWALTAGSLGACLGASWAGMRRAEGKMLWKQRPASPAVGRSDDAA